jgi:hypothetical protein
MHSYLPNKYNNYYSNIIATAKSRTLPTNVYTEKHHILPKSLGGSNDKSNLVRLTAREHFICHMLLVKFTQGKDRIKMIHAAWRMTCSANQENRHVANSHSYQLIRTQYIDLIKNRPRSEETKQKLRDANLGKIVPDWVKQKMKDGQKNRPAISEETRAKRSASLKGKNLGKTPRLGAVLTDESKKKMSQSALHRLKLTCPHCNRSLDPANYSRYHGDKCKTILVRA